jgi:hypothetical protein
MYVASAPVCLAHECATRYAALESRVITGYVAAGSAVVLLLQGMRHLARAHTSQQRTAPLSVNYVHAHGSYVILAFQTLRLFANGTLFSLAILTSVASDRSTWENNVLVFSSVSGSTFATPRMMG